MNRIEAMKEHTFAISLHLISENLHAILRMTNHHLICVFLKTEKISPLSQALPLKGQIIF